MQIYNISSLANVHNILNKIYNSSDSSFKINISFGFVFMNNLTGEVTAYRLYQLPNLSLINHKLLDLNQIWIRC